jgi:cystathionine beta-lyase
VAPPTLEAFEALSLDELRRRRSEKWRRYPADVLPAWVAEMDFPLPPPVRAVLLEAVERDDCGYANAGELPAAFVGFAASRFGWTVDAARVRLVADVMSGVAEALRALTDPGDRVVVNPPVYAPFFTMTREVEREVAEAPLGADRHLDLDALERAFAAGARAFLLCNPHNPTGTVFTRDELEAVAALSAQHDVLVVSDEVHAPMTMPGAAHTPFLSLGGDAAERGIAIVSASKTWNIAGLKCALLVVGSDRMDAELARVPPHVRYHTGHLGVLASVAAFRDGAGWLESLVVHLDANRRRLSELLHELLPAVRYQPPQAGYLAWLDCRGLGLGDDPAAAFLERGRVALSSGPTFGEQGRGFARLNFGTSSELLAEAVRRMAIAAGA